MDEPGLDHERLAQLRGQLEAAKEELAPLKASWEERADREAEELFSFALERGHFWTLHEEAADLGRRMLQSVAYGAGRDVDGPFYRATEKVKRLEGKVRWWEKKIMRDEHKARKARIAEYLKGKEEEE
jgi:hypothetical protein